MIRNTFSCRSLYRRRSRWRRCCRRRRRRRRTYRSKQQQGVTRQREKDRERGGQFILLDASVWDVHM